MDSKIILENRRNRVIATILGFKENEVDQYLPKDVSMALRKAILDQVNDLTNLAFDLMTPDSVTINEAYLQKIDEIHEKLGDLDGRS